MTVAAVILCATAEGALADTLGQPRVRRLVDIAWSGGALPVVVVAPDPEGAVAASLVGSEAVYAFVYPNLMLNRYGPILDTNLVVPLGPERCEVVFDYSFQDTEGEQARAFIERSIAASHRVQEEDVAICESVQKGLASPAYDRGIYAPKVEMAAHHFHRLLAADLG